jgi:hypothetical protein
LSSSVAAVEQQQLSSCFSLYLLNQHKTANIERLSLLALLVQKVQILTQQLSQSELHVINSFLPALADEATTRKWVIEMLTYADVCCRMLTYADVC